MNIKIVTVSAMLSVAFLAGCNYAPSVDDQQKAQQDSMIANANQQIGMPNIQKFEEMKLLKRLYEMRDQSNLATYAYIPAMDGKLYHLCDSMGFGIPYSTQFSNPDKLVGANRDKMAQSEPNGLYPSNSTSGTWVICSSKKGEFTPVYVEPNVIVSTFKLNSSGEYAAQ